MSARSPGGAGRRSEQPAYPLLVLDFDGVICDSAGEGLLSSWVAYYSLYKKKTPVSVPVGLRAEFLRLRPFIRGGEDFLIVQEIMAGGQRVENQEDFDELARQAGPERLALFKELFYEARSSLLREDRALWLGLNHVYPHMAALLERLPSQVLRVLSTKKTEFIIEILDSAHVRIPAGRIAYSGSFEKLPRVARMLDEAGLSKALFVDDQIDHLRGNQDPRISVYLASWGYVKQEWLKEDSGVPVVGPGELAAIIRESYGAGQEATPGFEP